jgi:2-aminoadipate transaminase
VDDFALPACSLVTRGAPGSAIVAMNAASVSSSSMASGVNRLVAMDRLVVAMHKAASEQRDMIGLAGGLPAFELMPRELLGEVLAEVARGDEDAVQYGWPEGLRSLREWIAARLSQRIALPDGSREEPMDRAIDPDRVIITAGAQQALSLIAMAHRGARIAVGDATYPSAIAAFERAGVEVVSRAPGALPRRLVSLESPAISYAIESSRNVRSTELAHYIMPGCSNPAGIDLVEPRRSHWLASGALITDEAYSELRFDGEISRPLCADAPDRVWHVGTLSKTVCPGLRVGWLVPPQRDHDQLLQLKEAADLQAASITQVAAARLLARMDYDRHLERIRAAYRERAARLCDALAVEMPYARFVEPQGGFAVWVELDEDGDDIGLLEEAIDQGTSIDPGRLFRPRDFHGPVSFRASFSSAPIGRIAEGVQRLARAVALWRARGRRRRRDTAA